MFETQSESFDKLKMVLSQLLTALAVLVLIHLEATPSQIETLNLQALAPTSLSTLK